MESDRQKYVTGARILKFRLTETMVAHREGDGVAVLNGLSARILYPAKNILHNEKSDILEEK